MTVERYYGLDRRNARQMIEATKNMTNKRSGDNGFYLTKVYLFDEYAVLKIKNITFRNVDIPDPDLKHLDHLAETLLDLYAQGVNVIPILGFISDGSDGYIIQRRAKGAELYERDKLTDKSYILERVRLLSGVLQEHYDKFAADAIKIMSAGVLIDFIGKDNFFYHEEIGFQFIDLGAHFDYVYGLTSEKPDAAQIAAWNCFIP